jgi:hypothetical protein
MQPVDVVRAKSFKDSLSVLVRAPTEQNVRRLVTMLTGETVTVTVTDASEAMKERATSVMCALMLDATDRQSRGPHAWRLSG